MENIYPTAKRPLWLLVGYLISVIPATAQMPQQPSRNNPVEQAPQKKYFTGAAGPNQRSWMKTERFTNSVGRVTVRTNLAYVELADGLNYRGSQTGEWLESDPSFELTAEGYAVASRGQHQVIVSPNLRSTDGVIDLQTPDGQRLRSSILGLNLFDPVSGKSLQIAGVRESIGVQISTNEIIWADAFDGLRADVRVRNERGRFHQDVLLREKLSVEQLALLGFDANTVRIEVWTEFLEAPAPSLQTQVRRGETNATIRASMAEPDQIDQRVDFGDVRMEIDSGKAFTEPESDQPTRIFKEWMNIDGRQYLIESATYEELTPLLQTLPVRTAALDLKPRSVRLAGNRLPPERPHLADRINTRQGISIAKLNSPASTHPVVVLDYLMTISGGITDYTFRGDTTYYVSGPTTASGTTIFEGGAVLKYAANASLTLSSSAPVNWQATPYRPVVFTAKDDDTVGDTVSGSTHSPVGYYANPALLLYVYGNSFTMTNFRVVYAQQAITYSYQGHTFAHGQFVNCANGIAANYGSVYVRNVLFANVSTAFNGVAYASISAENVTFGGTINYPSAPAFLATPSGSSPYSIDLKNCILARLNAFSLGNATQTGDRNGFWNNSVSPFGTSPITCPINQNPFQAMVGAGGYYLASDSPFSDQGSTAINADLAKALKQKTTSPPQERINVTVSEDTTLLPLAQRDTDVPDLGYHYDPVDFLASVWGFESCKLTIRGGTVIGYYDHAGLWLKDGAEIDCEGTALSLNRFVDYRTVQEQPVKLGMSYYPASTGNPLTPSRASGVGSPARLRFTEFSRMARGSYTGYDLVTSDGSNWKYSILDVRDCVFRGGGFSFNGSGVVSLINNLLEGSSVQVWGQPQLSLYNNLFKNCGYVGFDCQGSSVVVRDNAFDSVMLDDWSDPPLTHSHNAYINVKDPYGSPGRLNPAQTSDKVLTSFTYALGSLGNYYQVSTDLIDAGSRSATDAGLFHHTVKANRIKEGHELPGTGEPPELVDIGYHYIATLPQAGGAQAVFIRTDDTLQGSWKGTYGADGYNVIQNAISYPSYAQVSVMGNSTHTWAGSSPYTRALQKATASDRIAACWYSSANFTVTLNLTDGKYHRVAFYCLDWDSTIRGQTIEIYDASSNVLLDSRSVSSFNGGKYLVWDLKGNVKAKFINTVPGMNAVLSGFFFATGGQVWIDADGDGVPDYQEDVNGDGSTSGDPTSWQSYNSPNGLATGSGLKVFTPLQ